MMLLKTLLILLKMQTQTNLLYTYISTDSTLLGLLGGSSGDTHIYPASSNQFETFPCITYEEVVSETLNIPHNGEMTTVEFHIFARTSRVDLENIYTRLNNLLNYYYSTTNIFWVRKIMGMNMAETDRQLFHKVTRYKIWGRN